MFFILLKFYGGCFEFVDKYFKNFYKYLMNMFWILIIKLYGKIKGFFDV